MAKRIYNQTSLFGPLYAYLVVLSPPPHIKAAIAQIKQELNAIADITERNLHSIAHITLVDKLTDDVDFPATIEALIQNQTPFVVKLHGWGYFDHGHSITVYIDVENPEPIVNLMKLVNSPSRSPHISLAKKISHQKFEKLKPYLEQLRFKEEWLCEKAIVLRKLMSEKHLGFKDAIPVALKGR
jgi:2'-5' RNA ligase